jgi:hypothetical protein
LGHGSVEETPPPEVSERQLVSRGSAFQQLYE